MTCIHGERAVFIYLVLLFLPIIMCNYLYRAAITTAGVLFAAHCMDANEPACNRPVEQPLLYMKVCLREGMIPGRWYPIIRRDIVYIITIIVRKLLAFRAGRNPRPWISLVSRYCEPCGPPFDAPPPLPLLNHDLRTSPRPRESSVRGMD